MYLSNVYKLMVMGFSFGGPGSSMLQSYQSNEDQRKKRTHFNKDKAGGFDNQDKPEFNFPEATPQALREIRTKMAEQRKKLLYRAAIVGAIFLTLVIILLNFLG